MSRRAHILLLTLSTALLVVLSLSAWALYRASAPPGIQGKLILPSRAIPDFQLTDHHHSAFTSDSLKGQWHLLAYGFTHCPALCPATLAGLSSVLRETDAHGEFNDLALLFYSVDPARDTPEQLADYVPFFSARLTGLTRLDSGHDNHKPFEHALGMGYHIPDTDRFGNPYGPEDYYPVSHGLEIYLINPQGELQAIFQPSYNQHGMAQFSFDQVLTDYLAIRQYLAAR